MDSIERAYHGYLSELINASPRRKRQLLQSADDDQIRAILHCIETWSKSSIAERNPILRREKRWKRLVRVLKRNRKLLSPLLISVLCAILREVLHTLYNME